MTRIIDNIDEHLLPTLNEALAESTCLDACVGYFNLRGWNALCDQVDELSGEGDDRPPVRLLIGMQDSAHNRLRKEFSILRQSTAANTSQGTSQGELLMDNETANNLRKDAAEEFRQQLTWGIPSTHDERTLRKLRQQLIDGKVRVKLHLKHLLHAKLYLCHTDSARSPRTGFVGSSNLTFAGLSGQGELNVDVPDTDATKKLAGWFEDRWDDRLSVDITEDLIEIIDESWATDQVLSPYLIHLQIAYHLSRDARQGLLEYGLPESMKKLLLEFQAGAVQIAARKLIARNGAMIGDVVGLGKTIMAIAVARMLQEEYGYETLIVCPKNLVAMWKDYVEVHRIHAQVVSSSMHKTLKDLRRYRLLIVDESHNFRNRKTQAYQSLRDYVIINDPKVLLLTATPYNTSMVDVASQLGLFIDDDHDLGIRPEAAITAIGEANFFEKCDDKPSTLQAFRQSEQPEDWQRLLSQFLIRRTRSFIRDNYAELDEANGRYYLKFGDGSNHYLPERIPKPLPFKVARNDPASDMASDEVIESIESLRLPRYDMGRYVIEGVNQSNEEQEEIDRMLRSSGNLLGFTRTMLMKRLSSSGAVFILSLQRHLLRNYINMQAVRNEGHLPVGSVDDPQLFGGDADVELEIPVDEDDDLDDLIRTPKQWTDLASTALDHLEANTPNNVVWLRTELFDEQLLEDLEHDIEVISGLLERFGTWNERTDSKLDALQKLLTGKHKNEKVLIFSEYADSARYVADALKQRGITKLESATGSDANPTALACRFSPQSNKELLRSEVSEDDEIRVLVATDVLSEGQNLQDAAIVVNWDLPWAITKLIQRAGRVDRIGQNAEEVTIYTFLPTGGVEAVLRLRDRVAQRLRENATVFGADERFLKTPGETRYIRGIFSGNQSAFDDAEQELLNEGQVDYSSAAYEIWRNAEKNHPRFAAAVKALPDVAYATQYAKGAGDVPGALVYTLSQYDVDRIGFTSLKGESRRLTPLEALELSACDPDTPGLERMEEHHDLVNQTIEGPLSPSEFPTEGALSGVRKRVFEKMRDFLDHLTGQPFAEDEEVRQMVDAIHSAPLTEHAKQVLARARRERSQEDLTMLAVELHKAGNLVVDFESKPDEMRIVCSMGFAPRKAAKRKTTKRTTTKGKGKPKT